MHNFSFETLDTWSEQIEPVFIVGPERSGTSMMFRTVVSHPSFCSFDNATVETFAFIRPWELISQPGPGNYEMRLYLGKLYDSFMDAILPIIEQNKLCDSEGVPSQYLGGDKEQRSTVWKKRQYGKLLKTFFYFSWLNLGKKRIAEKTPAHVRCIDEIFDCFPKAKLLICLRNPAEIVASHRKRLEKEIELGKSREDPSLAWLNKTIEEYSNYLQFVGRKVQRAHKVFPQRILDIPYRRVTSDKPFLLDVFTFIGENEGRSKVAYDNKGQAPSWDPLLSANSPQVNVMNVKDWITEAEEGKFKELQESEILAGWSL